MMHSLDKGSYVLLVHLSQDARIKVGALGLIAFKRGDYAYVGSAMNSLSSRIDRHLLPASKKKVRWHIDYLLRCPYAKITEFFRFPSRERLECLISKKLSSFSAGVKGFGCSDCKCASHLYMIKKVSDLKHLKFGKIKV